MSGQRQVLDWVVPQYRWYWMRYRLTKRSKPKVILVQAVERFERTFVGAYMGTDYFPESICREWQARFIPTTAPPEVADFE